jgi:hypothetical protein
VHGGDDDVVETHCDDAKLHAAGERQQRKERTLDGSQLRQVEAAWHKQLDAQHGRPLLQRRYNQ